MHRILVSVVNYCDPEFAFTVKSLWENAKNKNSLIFSLVSEDRAKYDFSFIPQDQLVYRHYDLSEYRGGLCWARNLATKVGHHYDFFIQFDSHTLATFAWDEKAIKAYNSLPDVKRIISYCPAEYEILPNGQITTDAFPDKATIAKDFSSLIPGFTFPVYERIDDGSIHNGIWVTCCYLFAPKEWVDEVGIDQSSSFNTEEFSLSLRNYHKGWKIFAIGAKDVFHHSSHRQPTGVVTRRDLRPWADDRRFAYWSHVRKATNNLSKLLSGNLDVPLETVKEFLSLAGISTKYLEYNPEYYSHIDIPNRGYGMPPERDYN